jgi:hypothetical protein
VSDLEMELLKAEADEAAARARVEVLRRAAGTRAPDRVRSERKTKPKRALPVRATPPPTDTDVAAGEQLARDMGIPLLRGSK